MSALCMDCAFLCIVPLFSCNHIRQITLCDVLEHLIDGSAWGHVYFIYTTTFTHSNILTSSHPYTLTPSQGYGWRAVSGDCHRSTAWRQSKRSSLSNSWRSSTSSHTQHCTSWFEGTHTHSHAHTCTDGCFGSMFFISVFMIMHISRYIVLCHNDRQLGNSLCYEWNAGNLCDVMFRLLYSVFCLLLFVDGGW